ARHLDPRCEISGVGPIPVPVARGLLGQAVLKLVITRGVDVANVTHLGRGPTAAQRLALAWASPGCTVTGCGRTRIEYDHREPWARTRRTRLDELDPLCRYHHDLKTRHRWALAPGHGKRPLVPPDDPRHPRHQQKPRPG
ncbi:MAG TPA: HNH endonuclease signature motif containing protein, partial [Jiangellaceae bacterium]|nr:HNH endonuclease signature motif containing protein [Jiangellaceae bacterium]